MNTRFDHRILVKVTLALVALFPASLAAQADPKPNDTVRVTFASSDVPSLARMDQLHVHGDSLFLSGGSSSGIYALSDIRRVEVSKGKAWSKKWGVLGFFEGALAGAAIAWPIYSDDYGVPCAQFGNEGRDGCVALIAGGAVVGALLGSYLKASTRWETVPLDRLSIVAGGTGEGRISFGASLRR